ncbi:MAG: monooxygenase [Actinobacteria bacterium]|nr:monooxygenase [Actinomycetota bacterium]
MAGSDPTAVLHLWGVPRSRVPHAVIFMASQRRALRRCADLNFWKLLGTGSGRTFTMRDSDPLHWGLLSVWPDRDSALRFEHHRLVRQWSQIASERLRVELEPIASRGSWSGHQPFSHSVPESPKVTGPVAAITRARIKPSHWRRFAAAVPEVAADLRDDPHLKFSVGIGEAPIGLQGTFSIWTDAGALSQFAYRRPAHAAVVEQTHRVQWYAEELFARFSVRALEGTYHGASVDVAL